jgi:hypothetical protein
VFSATNLDDYCVYMKERLLRIRPFRNEWDLRMIKSAHGDGLVPLLWDVADNFDRITMDEKEPELRQAITGAAK